MSRNGEIETLFGRQGLRRIEPASLYILDFSARRAHAACGSEEHEMACVSPATERQGSTRRGRRVTQQTPPE